MPTLISEWNESAPDSLYLSGLTRVIAADSPLRSGPPASPDRTPCGAAQEGGAKKKTPKTTIIKSHASGSNPSPCRSSPFERCAPEAAFERHLRFCSTLPAERWFSATPVGKGEVGVTFTVGFRRPVPRRKPRRPRPKSPLTRSFLYGAMTLLSLM